MIENDIQKIATIGGDFKAIGGRRDQNKQRPWIFILGYSYAIKIFTVDWQQTAEKTRTFILIWKKVFGRMNYENTLQWTYLWYTYPLADGTLNTKKRAVGLIILGFIMRVFRIDVCACKFVYTLIRNFCLLYDPIGARAIRDGWNWGLPCNCLAPYRRRLRRRNRRYNAKTHSSNGFPRGK